MWHNQLKVDSIQLLLLRLQSVCFKWNGQKLCDRKRKSSLRPHSNPVQRSVYYLGPRRDGGNHLPDRRRQPVRRQKLRADWSSNQIYKIINNRGPCTTLMFQTKYQPDSICVLIFEVKWKRWKPNLLSASLLLEGPARNFQHPETPQRRS